MAISKKYNKVIKSGDGTTIQFSFDFKVSNVNNLKVIHRDINEVETTLLLGTDYTITGGLTEDSGMITMAGTYATIPPSATDKLILKNVEPQLQTTVYVEGDDFPAKVHEGALDSGVMIDLDMQEQINRAITFKKTSSASGATIPDPEDGKAILWSGTNLSNSSSIFENIVSDANVAKDAAVVAQTASEIAQGLSETAQGLSETAQGLSETAQTGSETAETNSGLNNGYAAEWANKAEDSLVSAAAGGDGINDYSAFHWGQKALADMTQTALDVIATAGDRVQTGLDIIASAASAAAALVSENAAAATLVLTNLDVISTAADVIASAASAAAALVSQNASATNAAFVANFGMPLYWVIPDIGSYPLDPYADVVYTIDDMRIWMITGSGTASITIDGVTVTGLDTFAISTTPTLFTATALNTVAVGQEVKIVLHTVSDPAIGVKGKMGISY